MNDFYVESFGHDERSTQFTKDGCCDSLVASDYKQPIIVAYIMDAMNSNSMKSSNPNSGFHRTETAKCLDTKCLDPSCNQGGMIVCYEGQNCCTDDKTAFTLQAGRPDDHHIPGICYAVENHPNDSRVTISENGVVQALTSRMGTGGGNVPLVLTERFYGVYSHPHGSIMKLEDEISPTLTTKMAKGSADGPLALIVNDIGCFQNTGQGWWNEGQIAETLRTPCGGDSTKANLVAYERR